MASKSARAITPTSAESASAAPTSPARWSMSIPSARASTAALEESAGTGRLVGSRRAGSGRSDQPLVESARLLVGVPGGMNPAPCVTRWRSSRSTTSAPAASASSETQTPATATSSTTRVNAGSGTSTAMPASTAAGKSESHRASSPSTTTSSPNCVGSAGAFVVGGSPDPERSTPTCSVSATGRPGVIVAVPSTRVRTRNRSGSARATAAREVPAGRSVTSGKVGGLAVSIGSSRSRTHSAR